VDGRRRADRFAANSEQLIEISEASAYEAEPTIKINSVQTGSMARMPQRTGNEPADPPILRRCPSDEIADFELAAQIMASQAMDLRIMALRMMASAAGSARPPGHQGGNT
jgi:hypothetical protein